MNELNNNILKTILIVATILAIVNIWTEGLGMGWIEGGTLFIAVFIIVFISAAFTYSRERAFESLEFNKIESESIVRRNSQINAISKQDLFVGDIVLLKEGDIVAADSIIIQGKLLVDQSHFVYMGEDAEYLTKEALKNNKDTDPFLISGTKIMSGSAETLVCAVGQSSQSYLISLSKNLSNSFPKPELQKKLEAIADKAGLVGIYIALAAFVAMVGNQIVQRIISNQNLFSGEAVKLYIEFLTVSIVIVIVALPESIPMALSIAWGSSLRKMELQHIRVKNINCIFFVYDSAF